VSTRVSRARAVVATGRKPAVVARVARVSRQALYRPIKRRPGYFRVTRPDELWHMDMTKVWTAAHGWVYLHVIVDCCTRRVAGWTVDVRTRSAEAIGCVEAAVLAHGIVPQQLTLGTDNGSQFTSRDFRKHLSARGITHRRGGYRDPESQAFIESWFGQFKKRCAWRTEWETIEDARTAIAAYVDSYHRRPHSGLGYRTPTEVARAWADPDLQTAAT